MSKPNPKKPIPVEYRFDSQAHSELFAGINSNSSLISTSYKLDKLTIDNLYRQNKFIQRIVDLIPQDCNSKQPQWHSPKVDSQRIFEVLNEIEVLSRPLERLDINGAFTLAHSYARMYGDGFIFLGIDDGQTLDKPVKIDKLKKISYIKVAHRYEVSLNPSRKTISCFVDNQSEIEFHFSRVLRFSGIRSELNFNYFNDSVLDAVFQQYLDYTCSLKASREMLESHSVFKLGIDNLQEILKRDIGGVSKKNLNDRFQHLLYSISAIGAISYDSRHETVEFTNRSYSGVEPILNQLRDWLISVADMPRGKIMGEAASGSLSSATEGEKDIWNETIARHQHAVLKPNHLLLGKYICNSLGEVNPSLNLSYESHYPLTQLEEAQLRKTIADTDKIYIDNGVLTSEEVRQARFKGSVFDFDIQV